MYKILNMQYQLYKTADLYGNNTTAFNGISFLSKRSIRP